jgi:hypothetical protein
MYKVTEVIGAPRTGSIAELDLDEYIAVMRRLPFLTRFEVARPLEDTNLPPSDHCLLIEGWFDDLAAARAVPQLPEFPAMDAMATRIHARAGIARYMSKVA